jgi:hypothetical protein
MNVLFLGVCGMSLMFFGFYFLACHRETSRRKPHGSCVLKISPEIQAIDSPFGRHYLIHLEKQMAGFVTHHRSGSVADRLQVAPLGPAVRP